MYVTDNPLLTAPDGLWRIWFSLDSPSQYFPLTYTTFYLERGLWGLNPAGYHWVNLLLHAANALLVWQLLLRLRVPGAWLAAAVFALHPVQVESVAWITELKNVLMGFFFLLTLWTWIKFIDDRSKRPWRFYTLALACCALALCAKTTACTLPAALLLILWLDKKPVGARQLAQMAPFVAMSIGMGLVTIWWGSTTMGTHGSACSRIAPLERVLIASRALWFYTNEALLAGEFDVQLSAMDDLRLRPVRLRVDGWRPRVLGAVILVGAAMVREEAWKSRQYFLRRRWAQCWDSSLLYTFLYSFVADHYQYLACIGPIALAVAGATLGLGPDCGGEAVCFSPRSPAALVITLGALTWQAMPDVRRAIETLWETTLQPESRFLDGPCQSRQPPGAKRQFGQGHQSLPASPPDQSQPLGRSCQPRHGIGQRGRC